MNADYLKTHVSICVVRTVPYLISLYYKSSWWQLTDCCVSCMCRYVTKHAWKKGHISPGLTNLCLLDLKQEKLRFRYAYAQYKPVPQEFCRTLFFVLMLSCRGTTHDYRTVTLILLQSKYFCSVSYWLNQFSVHECGQDIYQLRTDLHQLQL